MEGDQVVSSYLRSKLSSRIDEAEAEMSRHLQIIPRFRSIGRLIDSLDEDWGDKTELLNQLISALSECVVFAHRQSTGAAVYKVLKVMRGVVFERKMRSRLDEIEGKIKNSGHRGTLGESQHTHTQPDLPNFPAAPTIWGFESEVAEIEKSLAGGGGWQQFTAIGIVGRCGCGKTALAQKVLGSSRIEEMFSPIIYVRLSTMLKEESSDLRVTILNFILREIRIGQEQGQEDGDYSVVKLLERVQVGLMEKRYLIVLDDAWRMDEWFADLPGKGRPTAESFSQGLPKGSGGAVIVTSRSESVIRGMVGEKHVIRPHLSDEICWEVFTHAVRQLELIHPEHPKLIRIKHLIIRNCAGLPLAAITLANVIANLISDSSSQ